MARKTDTKKTAEKLSAIDVGRLRERIATKAFELYQQHGGNHGHDLDHWLTAERLVQEELAHDTKPEKQKRTQKARKKK